MQLDRVNTHQLNEGDLVLNHDMLIRLHDLQVTERNCGDAGQRAVWSFRGVVENEAEVRETAPDVARFIRDGQFTIQGNDLAWWSRVDEGHEESLCAMASGVAPC